MIDLYDTFAPVMKTGDMLFFHGHKPVSILVRAFSRGYFSHTSMVTRLAEVEGAGRIRRYHTEADGARVYPGLLSRKVWDYDGEVWYFPLKDEWDIHRGEILDRLAEMWGVPYDFRSLFRNIVTRVNADASKLFCSEMNYLALGYTGKAPTPSELAKFDIFKGSVMIWKS